MALTVLEFLFFYFHFKKFYYKEISHKGWITKHDIIEHIKEFNWSCYVYVTPYQIKSSKLKAIEEYNIFIDLLSKYNVNMRNRYYFEEKEDDFDIDIHFEILNIFDSSLI